ncbi:MAG: UPF0149 family protein [Xanthomonadales bacterium]|nr:hypothetical protein [Xanthomonadales bacterium]MCC6592117.1 UPF0149 family protein [Xanthomonadales bacterium]MCE7932534.1 YecA family protein [Xanthomonadales bacterium PRO6]
MSELPEDERPSPLAPLFTPAEGEELAMLMLSFDGGMLDYGELDGFLSALAVAPQPTTLERWWNALFGPEPEWETEHEPVRAKALVERYYAMVQARVAVDPVELGVHAIPPLESVGENLDWADDADDVEDLASPAHQRGRSLATCGGAPGIDVGSVEDEGGEFAAADEAVDDDESDEDAYGGQEIEFGYGETWLSGFRYALSLQADDWRRVLDEEPALARWLHALWVAADAAQGEGGPLDALPAMAPTAAAPEDAGFLTLEAALRERAAQAEALDPLDEDALTVLLPPLLHQLWRRHRRQAGVVAAKIASAFADGLLGVRDYDEDRLHELLRQHAGADGMSLERLDGWWSAQRAAGLEVSPWDSLERIFGGDKVWEDVADAREVMSELLMHWNRLGERLQRKPDPDDPLCDPFIDYPVGEDPSAHPQRPYGREFAQGFLAAVGEFPRSAQLLLMDPEAKHWLAPFEALAHGRSLEKKGKRLDYEERMGLIAELPECIAELGRFWTAGSGTPRPPVRVEPLPGRNDPCPCGSGRKYKKCHGAPERLH